MWFLFCDPRVLCNAEVLGGVVVMPDWEREMTLERQVVTQSEMALSAVPILKKRQQRVF